MQTLAPDYRAQDIESAVKKYGDLVIDKWPDHKDGLFLTHPHNQLAAVGCFGLLQQLDPERFRDTVRWTDIFSDIRFYQTDKVETLPQ
jgi:hypothetical protein